MGVYLHIAIKRAWALDKTWGDVGFHQSIIHDWLLNEKALLGAGNTFGRMELSQDLHMLEKLVL